jgi:integrase/recombinase XerD
VTHELIKFDNNCAIDIKRAAWSSLSEESRLAYQSDFNLFFKYINKEQKEVTANDILSYIQYLEKKGMKNSTINRKIASLSKMFRILVMAGEIKYNPVEVLKQLKNVSRKTSREIKVSLTIEDIRKVTKLKSNSSEQERKIILIIRFLTMTGLRISELTGIKNNDITDYDKENKKVRIVGKGKKERFVFLPNELLYEIKKLYPNNSEIDNLFYSGRYHRYCRKMLWRKIHDIFKKKINKKMTVHDLRHFFITYKISVDKIDIKSVSKYVGHSSTSITLDMYCDTSLDIKNSKIKI